MKEEGIQRKIAIFKCPKFWKESGERPNLRPNSKKGQRSLILSGDICTIMTLKSVNEKTMYKGM